MEMNTIVIPKTGYYLVRTVGPRGINTHLVGKDKHCTCGGHAGRWCSHIQAVADYLKAGGTRAPEAEGDDHVRDSRSSRNRDDSMEIPEVCPVCGAEVHLCGTGAWRCVDDSTHYYQWRSEQNGGAIRKFLTQPHPAKRGPFYALSGEERHAFLIQAARRMHLGGYTPHSS
jgi:hypothetical protein